MRFGIFIYDGVEPIDVGGTADVIKDGETGYLLSKPSVEELESKLGNLLNNAPLRDKMSVSARKDAVARYSVTTNIRRTVELMVSSL